jgi:hypothetical protein
MNTITVSHRGRLVALAAPRRFWLAADIEALPEGHPRKRFVALMVLYARDVLTGELPGPYSDQDAERFACLALLDPSAQHAGCSDPRLAGLLGLSLAEVPAFPAEEFEQRPIAAIGPRPRPWRQRRRRSPGCSG